MTSHAKRAETTRTSILSAGTSAAAAFTVLHGATAVNAVLAAAWTLLAAVNAGYTLVDAGRTRRWSTFNLAAGWFFVATLTVAATTLLAIALDAALA